METREVRGELEARKEEQAKALGYAGGPGESIGWGRLSEVGE